MARVKNHEISEAFLNSAEFKKDLIYHKGYEMFYMYKDGWYRQYDEEELRIFVRRYLMDHHSDLNITISLIKDILGQVQLGILRRVEKDDHAYICLKDGLLSLENFDKHEHTRKKIVTHYLPYTFEELGGECPNWYNFLKTTFVDKTDKEKPDYEMIKLVRQMMGFFLLGNMYGGKAFFLTGNGANGKSVLTSVLENIFGDEFCSTMSIQTLTTDKFATAHLVGKRINISNEEESKYIKSDKFKALITGNKVDGEHKFGKKFEFKPHTKFIFATNRIPTFEGLDYGLRRRIVIIPFFNKFTGENRDIMLEEKLKAELPAIINWAIGGAKELKESEYDFISPRYSEEMLKDFENEVSSALRFAREEYVVEDGAFISVKDLYSHYKIWCDECGKKPMSQPNFLRDIGNNIDDIESLREYDLNQKRVRGRNLRRITEEDLEDELISKPIMPDFLDGDDANNELKKLGF